MCQKHIHGAWMSWQEGGQAGGTQGGELFWEDCPAPHPFPPSLTLCFRASGAVHFTGSKVASAPLGLTRAKPKSLTLATFSSEMRMLRAARSLCTSFLDSR